VLGERVITANVSLVAADSFRMVWPFEVMILQRRHMVLLQYTVFTSAGHNSEVTVAIFI
jgi:galactose-1-phosphate uridylyltransferase